MSAKKLAKHQAWVERAKDVPGGEAIVERSKEFSDQIERARRMIEDDSISWTAAEGHGDGPEGAKAAQASILTRRKRWLLEV